MVDVHGAVWTGRNQYELVPSAKRYELYEMSYAAKVLLQLWPCLMTGAAASLRRPVCCSFVLAFAAI